MEQLTINAMRSNFRFFLQAILPILLAGGIATLGIYKIGHRNIIALPARGHCVEITDSSGGGQTIEADTFSIGMDPEIIRAYDSEVRANCDTNLNDSFHPYPGRILFHNMDSAERSAMDSCISISCFPEDGDTIYISRGDHRPIAKGLKSTGKIIWMDTVAYRAAQEWMKKYNQKKEGREL